MKKWIASAIAITMSLNNSIRADNYPSDTDGFPDDGYPEAVIESPNQVLQESGQGNPEHPDADEEETVNTDPVASGGVVMTPAADVPPLENVEDMPDDDSFVEVGKASSESVDAVSRQRWQRVAIAAGAVVIATIALILVGQNQGRHHHH